MTDKLTFSQIDIDQLKEVSNIGAGNAATALSHMIGQRVEMTIPESFVGGIEMVQRELGDLNEKVIAVFFEIHGDMDGAMVMILPPASAISLTKLLTHEEVADIGDINDKHLAAVQEMGNILLGASTTALGKFLNISIIHTIPDAAVDMLGSVIDEVLVDIGDKSGEILVFKVSIGVDHGEARADMYYLFDPISSAAVLHHTSKKIA